MDTAPYTRLTEIDIATILQQFEIGPVTSFQLLTGGYENTNYLIETTHKKYVLGLFEQKSEQEVEKLARLLLHLEAQKLTTSKIISSSTNELFIIWKNNPIMMRTFIEGKVIEDLSPNLLTLIGKEVAKLHQIKAPEYLPKRLNYGKEQFVNIKKYAVNADFDTWLKKVLDYIAPYFALDLPKSLIHSDIFWDNVIIDNQETSAFIMDFEESTYYYRVFDLGMSIIGLCAEGERINLEKAKHFLKAYQSEIQLTKEEIIALKAFTIYAGASMTYWRYINFNHTKPDPTMYHHYLGLKVLVDHVFKLDDACFAQLMEGK